MPAILSSAALRLRRLRRLLRRLRLRRHTARVPGDGTRQPPLRKLEVYVHLDAVQGRAKRVQRRPSHDLKCLQMIGETAWLRRPPQDYKLHTMPGCLRAPHWDLVSKTTSIPPFSAPSLSAFPPSQLPSILSTDCHTDLRSARIVVIKVEVDNIPHLAPTPVHDPVVAVKRFCATQGLPDPSQRAACRGGEGVRARSPGCL